MQIEVVKSKIHRVSVTGADLDYVGSITLDDDLMEAAGIIPGERVYIVNVNNGERFDTYTISGEKGTGAVVLNGPAARKVQKGDIIIIIAYASLTPEEAKTFKAKIVKIYPSFNTEEQSYVVEAQFNQVPNKIFSGSQLQANIATGSSKNVLVIPTAYLIRENDVILENDEERTIKIGRKNSNWTEVISGITEEDLIVKPKI